MSTETKRGAALSSPPLVWLARPREDAGPLADLLRGMGFSALIAPLMEIKLHATPLEMAPGDGLLFTSANGVRAFCSANRNRNSVAFAVGAATAGLARRSGFGTVFEAGGDVDRLIECVKAQYRPSDGVLHHIAGSVLAGDLKGGLEMFGFRVERHVCYTAEAAVIFPETVAEKMRDGALSAVLFHSPRTAALAVELLEKAGILRFVEQVGAVCLSQNVARQAEKAPWRFIRIAESPDQAALLAALQSAI